MKKTKITFCNYVVPVMLNMMPNIITFMDWFSGVGGFRLGLEQARLGLEKANISYQQVGAVYASRRGTSIESRSEPQPSAFECVGACEWDRWARAVYAYNFGHEPEWGDAKAVDPHELPDFDLLAFGWPCQDNSLAGGRAGQREGTRSGLLDCAVEILRVKKPSYFIAENVPGLFSVNDGHDFYATIRAFTDVGYDVQWQVLNTRWFLPQNRERIYFIGNRKDLPKRYFRGISRPQVFPIGEATEAHNETDSEVTSYIDSNYHKGWLDHGQRTMVLTRTRSNQDYLNAEVEPPLRQSDKAEILVAMTAYTKGNRKDSRIQNTSTYPWLDGSQAYAVGQPRLRRLTPRETERLQGFPDDWTRWGVIAGKKIEISDTQRYKMMGNAVSVPVVQCVAEKLAGESCTGG